jgi:hypothetical protein
VVQRRTGHRLVEAKGQVVVTITLFIMNRESES